MIALYLGVPGSGKSTLMKEHVMRSRASLHFLVVDHDGSWVGPLFTTAQFREAETIPRLAVFRGSDPLEVAQLAIDLGDSVLVDDEVDIALAGAWKGNPVREIVKRGRHLLNAWGDTCSVSAMFATHRPANLPTDITGLMTRVYLGRLQSYADAERVYREGWLPEARKPKEVHRILSARAIGEFTMWGV